MAADTVGKTAVAGSGHRPLTEGIKNVRTGKMGDLYIVLNLVLPNKLTREQKDLFEALSKTDLTNNDAFKKFDKINR